MAANTTMDMYRTRMLMKKAKKRKEMRQSMEEPAKMGNDSTMKPPALAGAKQRIL